ncbi:mesoderm posterior protein 1-like [Indicator indicator]|uniref:mesoderm posterior protein 1-like n=1 Tax=Indicator indicator TaxID=1002788 RepID=UPI0023DEC14B|nr:mesoderm posterior protein 1-like [Indicator indicator]
MARSAAPGLPLPATAPLQAWGCRGPPDLEGYSSSSPAASPDSCGLSSPTAARAPCRSPAAPHARGVNGGRKGVRAAGLCGGPRQSASEREKLRMRRLAQALLRLRHYLPPTLAPAGQSLTKIETLRLATRYIAHLSALLGLSEEVLTRRRGTSPRHCPLCPQGLGCCQGPAPRLCPSAPLDASSPGSVGWGSPPTLHRSPDMETGSWGFPHCMPVAEISPELLGVPHMGMGVWGSPPYIPATESPTELHGVVASNESSWLSPPHCAGTPLDPLSDPLLDSGLMLPDFVDAGTVTQDLSTDLLSLLEALLPPQSHD